MDSDEVRRALPRLLDLQAEDTAIKRLTDRRASLPETARLAELTEQLAELDADVEIATKQNDEAARECNRLEGEIELLDGKIAREEQRLFSGAVANPKELSALQSEVAMLKKKKETLEDDLLEAMEQREEAAGTLGRLRSERSEVGDAVDELRSVVGKLTAEIDADLARHTEERGTVAGEIPADLLALYDRLRGEKAGVGAAALDRDLCLGCHTKLPAKEVERVRTEGGLQRCDNCRRILVVT